MVKNKAYAGRPPGLVIGIATLGILLLAGGADVAELPGDNVKLTYIIAPYITQPYIALEPASGTAGSGITVRGTGFDVSGEEFPQAAIYFDNRIVREGVWIEVDERGLGSFITSFTVPSGINPGIYEVVAYGPKDAFAPAEFEVEPFIPPWQTTPLVIFIIATFTIILAVVILKYLRNPGQLQINTQPQQINIETRGGSESMYESELRQYAINVEERGGIERLKKDEL
jgi:hypothetical protein